MKGQMMKRGLAALLCAAMLFTQSAAVLAEGGDAAVVSALPLTVSAEYEDGYIKITVGNVTGSAQVDILNENGGSEASATVTAESPKLRLRLDAGTYTVKAGDATTTVTVPEPTATPTPDPTETPTPEPTATPTPEPTATPTPDPTATPTPDPTATPTPEPTETPTPEPTATPTPESTETPEPTPTPETTEETPTPSPDTTEETPTPVPEATATPTAEPTTEPTSTPTPEPTTEPTATPAAVSGLLGSTLNASNALLGSAAVQTEEAFDVKVTQREGMFIVTVTGAQQALVITLAKPDGSNDKATLESGSGRAYFADLVKGDYTVTVECVSGDTNYQYVTDVTLEAGVEADEPASIVATARAGENKIEVTVSDASDQPVMITLYQGNVIKDTARIEAGKGSVVFSGIAAGTYTAVAAYESGSTDTSCTIENLVVVDSVAKIAITSVKGGENKLTVTGTAQPNTDITLTTEPASIATIVRSDASGNFTATLVCSAGTYTAVYAQYGSDTASRVAATGTYTVASPTSRPPITVNPITEKDSTVIARSNPGTIVNLGTYDYGQTLTADSRGILQFSLPHEYVNGTKITFTVYYGNGKEFSYQYVVTVGTQTVYTQLKRGDKGYDVYELTQRLVELGYLKSATTGYDDTVVAAVRQFQANNGLAVDGIAGQLTQTALWSVSAIGAMESGIYPTLVRGDRGLALIYTLQQRLKDLGYYTIRVDGIFGSGTQRAVRDFQYVNGLTVTGKADHATQTLLYSSAAKPVGSVSSGSYVTLSRSSRYDARVVTLQRRLKALGYYAGSIDGYFGSQTYRAVRNFQYVNGLTVTGIADAYTQQVLYSSAAKTASGKTSGTTTTAGYRLLYWGCTGDAVTRLQKALLNAGYTQVRTADGIFGQWTYDAVCAFQKDNGLTVDGIAGKNTQNKLYGTSY